MLQPSAVQHSMAQQLHTPMGSDPAPRCHHRLQPAGRGRRKRVTDGGPIERHRIPMIMPPPLLLMCSWTRSHKSSKQTSAAGRAHRRLLGRRLPPAGSWAAKAPPGRWVMQGRRRATGDHVGYRSDAWMWMSLLPSQTGKQPQPAHSLLPPPLRPAASQALRWPVSSQVPGHEAGGQRPAAGWRRAVRQRECTGRDYQCCADRLWLLRLQPQLGAHPAAAQAEPHRELYSMLLACMQSWRRLPSSGAGPACLFILHVPVHTALKHPTALSLLPPTTATAPPINRCNPWCRAASQH